MILGPDGKAANLVFSQKLMQQFFDAAEWAYPRALSSMDSVILGPDGKPASGGQTPRVGERVMVRMPKRYGRGGLDG